MYTLRVLGPSKHGVKEKCDSCDIGSDKSWKRQRQDNTSISQRVARSKDELTISMMREHFHFVCELWEAHYVAENVRSCWDE